MTTQQQQQTRQNSSVIWDIENMLISNFKNFVGNDDVI